MTEPTIGMLLIRVDALDTRVGGFDDRIATLARMITAFRATVNEHGEAMAGLTAQVEALLPELQSARGYQPQPTAKWWELDDGDRLHAEDRREAVRRLTQWVEGIYRVYYAHLAKTLPPCWAEHRYCLVALDTLSELWALLYLPRQRAASLLASQAEFLIRTMPEIARQMALDTAGCSHQPAPAVDGRAGA